VLHYEVGSGAVSGAQGAFVANRRLVVSAVQAGAGAAAGTVELRIDGALDNTGIVELPRTLERRGSYLGRNSYTAQADECSVFFQGLIGEVLFYPRGVTAGERQRVEAYLSEKWQGAVTGAVVGARPNAGASVASYAPTQKKLSLLPSRSRKYPA
jgi:hypothetical protein